jgi:hypothetical protein
MQHIRPPNPQFWGNMKEDLKLWLPQNWGPGGGLPEFITFISRFGISQHYKPFELQLNPFVV